MRALLPLLALILLPACQPAGSQTPGTSEARPRAGDLAVDGTARAPMELTRPAEAAEADAVALPELTRGTSRIPAALRGRWTVVRQTVVGQGPQAYGENDAELLGQAMTVTATGARWSGTTPLTGACEDAYYDGETTPPADLTAALAALSARPTTVLDFLCMGEASDWGVAGDRFEPVLLSDGRLVLTWFDNLVLVLSRG